MHVNKVFRVIDANLNRAKEGLRICEDVSRFILDDGAATAAYKKIRHALDKLASTLGVSSQRLLLSRNTPKDVGRKSSDLEFQRKNICDVFFANSQRAKESIRVLEEFSKLFDRAQSRKLKVLRYQIYILEGRIAKKLEFLPHFRHRS